MTNWQRASGAALLVWIFGCDPMDGPGDSDDPGLSEITYSEQVSRLLQQHCQGCHRPEGLAPFPLLTYEDAAGRALAIKDAVVSRRMPHGVSMRLDTGCAEADTFLGPRRLTQEEIDTIATWVDEGSPEGDPSDLPPPREFPSGEWVMGTPDFEAPNSEVGFTFPPNLHRDVFRRFVIPTDFDGERFITGFEALPDAAGGLGLGHVVHHVTLFVNPGGEAFQHEAEFAESDPEIPGPGFEGQFTYPVRLIGMWFPGSAPLELPDGLGVRLPPGAPLVMEVHYSPSQDVVADETRIGLRLEEEVSRVLEVGLVKNTDFIVPAGDPAYQVDADRSFDEPFTLYSITPHQHQLGTDFRVMIDRPGEDPMCLADVEWDFEHQGTYRLKEPLELPAGTMIRTHCIYDNSEANPNQFNDPPADIEFGAFADHEMCQLTIGSVFAGGPVDPPEDPPGDPQLVEVYYDNPGDDFTAEWIKLHNPTDQPIDLAGYAFGWGGADYTYGTLDLSGTLPAGECLVVGAVPDELIGLKADFMPDLQNSTSDAADGVGLFAGAADDITPESVPVDAVLYGETNLNELLAPNGQPGAVDVDAAPPGDSIRKVNGAWVIDAPAPSACP